MKAPRELFFIDQAKATCCGDDAQPHPVVFLSLEPKGFADCPYCGKRYVEKGKANGAQTP